MTVATVGLSGLRKAAILLVQLGRDRAAKILSILPEQMVEDLTAEIVRLRDVSSDDASSVLTEAHHSLSSSENSGRGGLDLAKLLLADSVGSERAEEIMERLGATLAEMPFESMRKADARQLITFLGDEHPQTIALVLAHLSPQQSALVLSGFEQEIQADIDRVAAIRDGITAVSRKLGLDGRAAGDVAAAQRQRQGQRLDRRAAGEPGGLQPGQQQRMQVEGIKGDVGQRLVGHGRPPAD